MSRLAMCLVLCACAPTSSRDTLPADQAPPPLVLTAPDLYEGQSVTFQVAGANPRDRIVVAASTSTAIPGFCPPALRGACVQLLAPQIVGLRTADAAGTASITVPVPSSLTPGSIVWFQAAAFNPTTGFTSSRTLREVFAATCPQTVTDFWAEAEAVRSCQVAADCGQVMTGTSCGCTRDWVARNGADLTDFYDLLDQAGACGVGLFSTCDCPAVNGFDCVDNQCTWDYSGTP